MSAAKATVTKVNEIMIDRMKISFFMIFSKIRVLGINIRNE
jgi:hypothetical protein